MSKFFKEVDFGDPLPLTSPSENQPVETFPERKVFEKAVKEIHEEIVSIQHGGSELTATAIYFPKGQVLPAIMLDRFIQKPSRTGLVRFLAIAKQDLGARPADFFRDKFNEVLEEVGVDAVHAPR
jgi:hypothetical protein